TSAPTRWSSSSPRRRSAEVGVREGEGVIGDGGARPSPPPPVSPVPVPRTGGSLMTVAALEDVGVDYARGPALGPFDLGVAEGEIVALVGPSGCGKSTALRLLAGLERPTRGTIRRAAGRGETAVVFQAPTLAPWLSATANVALPLELAGTPK